MKKTIHIFWFRRDLRLHDNHALYQALSGDLPVLPLFIFDTDILHKLEDKHDARVHFIYETLIDINRSLQETGSSLLIRHGKPLEIFRELIQKYEVNSVFANHDYEPYARERDLEVEKLLKAASVDFRTCKDQVIFEKDEVLKPDGKPYTVFTPYSKRWKANFNEQMLKPYPAEKLLKNLMKQDVDFPLMRDIGFEPARISFPKYDVSDSVLSDYNKKRDFPAQHGTTLAGTYLRFGVISIRELAAKALRKSETYLNELIWREFFMQILWHHPEVTTKAFKSAYDHIPWENDEEAFQRWCNGQTGFPLVDAGMRQLNQTGFMHNRLRMLTASFLCKHLLIDWRWGEAYFAAKLFDFELASNNGNWQWAAGSGCDAAPYFRIFNPHTQIKKFDAQHLFIRKFVPEINTKDYPAPMLEHDEARKRALKVYKDALQS